MEKSTDSPRIIELPRIYDPRGNLTFVENGDGLLPFHIGRVHWTYDIPAGAERGGHAHYTCSEVVVAAAGSFSVKIFDGRRWSEYSLNRPYQGLLLPPGYWRVLDNYASGSICLTLADEPYREDDYIRDIDEYIRLKTQ